MHSPFILAIEVCGDAQDDDFPLTQMQRAFLVQEVGDTAFKEALAVCEGAEQRQQIAALLRLARQYGGDARGKRRFKRLQVSGHGNHL